MPSKKIEDLDPELQCLYHDFAMRMADEGLQYIVTCTYRSQEEQNTLYAQGRTSPGKIVTWTKKSRHTGRRAFDIAMVVDGVVSWDTDDYLRAGEIGEEVGLEWGGSWSKPDYPHFQLPGA